ncbi:hypothetical protein I4F81_008992 [Pyropia yezoensis]|uniref:Uncharacterized protein n=1 Tax=Pyropia yezoensis TaxID=2788 RepID=A0ACC3C8K7_PYRYE|nr:hypothetical protein I4F81_008992 [Neopyropia yezoensis]
MLVADLEVLAGRLYNVMRSRKAELLALHLSTCRDVVDNLRHDLYRYMCTADSLRSKMGLTSLSRLNFSQRVVVKGPVNSAQESVALPSLPPNVYSDWDNAELPAVRLLNAVMGASSSSVAVGVPDVVADGAPSRAFVAALGVGGMGKTLSCLQVAHRAMELPAGILCFREGVYWVQLSRGTTEARFLELLCNLATTLSHLLVVAPNLKAAVTRLRVALEGKSCLVVFDDVRDYQIAALILESFSFTTTSSLLLSTRNRLIASQGRMTTAIEIGVLVASVAAAKPTMSSVLADKSACAYAALMKARLAIIEEPKTMTQTTIIATVTANVVDLRTLILAHFILKVATALSDSILLLREELDAKERKRKQLAVANSVVKVVVSLAPIVGGVIGSSVEAAANILSGIDPASFSSGANMMSFVQDFDKVKAVDTILAQIPEVLSDEQRAALDGGLSLENVRQEFAMAANFGLQRPQSSEVDEDGAPQSLLRTCAAQSSSSGEAKCAFNDVIDSEDLR